MWTRSVSRHDDVIAALLWGPVHHPRSLSNFGWAILRTMLITGMRMQTKLHKPSDALMLPGLMLEAVQSYSRPD